VEDALGAWREAVRLAPSEPRYRHALETLVGRRTPKP